MVYLSTYLTPHTVTFGDIGLLRSVFRACMGRNVQLLFIAGPAGAEGTTGGCDDDATAASGAQTGKALSPALPTTCAVTMHRATASKPKSCACRICIPHRRH
mgnify:FL=1